MLENEPIAEGVYQLAEQIDSDGELEKEEAKKSITHIFKEDLKQYVPPYHDSTSRPRAPEDIKQQHLTQRWDPGSLDTTLDSTRNKKYLKTTTK
jgi:hypothetical protein